LTIGLRPDNPGAVDVSEDLTARARIRDAAVRRFGSDGFAGTPVRRIATDARVSAALVVHHFGSKQGLVDACDGHAMAVARAAQRRGGDVDGSGPVLRYLVRAMVERPESTVAMFDEMVAETERTLAEGGARPSGDPRLRAAVLVSMELGGLALRTQLSRYLGVDAFSPAGVERLGEAMGDVLTGGLFGNSRRGTT
jgi:AcrR family transcriptional regulator